MFFKNLSCFAKSNRMVLADALKHTATQLLTTALFRLVFLYPDSVCISPQTDLYSIPP